MGNEATEGSLKESRNKHHPGRLLGFNKHPEITFGTPQQLFKQMSRQVKPDLLDAQTGWD